MDKFVLHSKYSPSGDQPQAIKKLAEGVEDGLASQVLLGVTGSGKTFTMANVIEKTNRPALVLAHNKTLAAQLCSELKEFFPENAVEFFVSYYDYYQPESYIVASDTYIEKDADINEEIDKLRHSATSSLMERKDVIVVASVSCIYGLGAPEEYFKQQISLRPGMTLKRDDFIAKLIEIQYKRNDIEFARTNFKVLGDIVEVFPANSTERAIRVEFFGNEVETISEIDAVTKKVIARLNHIAIMPASHFVQDKAKIDGVVKEIKTDLEEQKNKMNEQGKQLEAFRLNQRVNYDLEMIQEMGYCSGIENYSRYFDGRKPGEAPYTLLDYFPDDFIMFIDESHITLPQVRAMYNGDKARKTNLIDYGFRLPSAADNRPLTFDEFNKKINQTIYISATPSPYELTLTHGEVAEQIIRPTGLLDPVIEIRKSENQIDDLISEIHNSIKQQARVMVTTLTKKMAETLSNYFIESGIKAKWLHSEIDTLERIEIINALRRGEFDVIVGINLLREGLDIPEVNLVAILDADKEGFLRSETSLIQIIGRAARNKDARVIMYADTMTNSMKRAINETNRRRKIQEDYNKKHNITPKTIIKELPKEKLMISKDVKEIKDMDKKTIYAEIDKLKALMQIASSTLKFEEAIEIREEIARLRSLIKE